MLAIHLLIEQRHRHNFLNEHRFAGGAIAFPERFAIGPGGGHSSSQWNREGSLYASLPAFAPMC